MKEAVMLGIKVLLITALCFHDRKFSQQCFDQDNCVELTCFICVNVTQQFV